MHARSLDPAAFARARSRVYGLLAAAFDGDVGALADAMAEDAFGRLARHLPVDLDVDALARDDVDAEALSVGYDNLFVVPGPHYVPPFASAHAADPSAEQFESDSPYHEAGAAGELLGDPASEIVRVYDRVGFRPERGDGIPDHVAAEFEFLSALAAREARLESKEDPSGADVSAADLRELQAETLSRLGWLDSFDETLQRHDRAEGVFAALSRFARSFAAWDARKLDAR
jgi:TorA maturation chaperone TorD